MSLEVAEGSFAPDIIEHISGVSNVIPDHLSRKYDPKLTKAWVLPEALSGAAQRVCCVRASSWWRTADRTSE